MSDDTDRASFSMSMDSGIGSPPPFSMQAGQAHNLHTATRSLMVPNSDSATCGRSQKAVDHTSKEKHRRERIKDSCDQLRILLPYIRGRKTDMASILEMCVDYLHIINTFMPQALQDEVVDILSKDPNLVPNRESVFNRNGKENKVKTEAMSKLKTKGHETSTSSCSSSVLGPVDKKFQPNNYMLAPTADQLGTVIDVRAMVEGKGVKRARRMETAEETVSDCTSLDIRLEPTVGHNELTAFTNYHATAIHTKGFQELEEQPSFGRYITTTAGSHVDGYNTAQQMFNTYSSNKNLTLETESFRPTFSEPTMFHYYPSAHTNTIVQPRLPFTTVDYVNPNSVLSDSVYNHSVRLKQEISHTSTVTEASKDETTLSRL